MVTSLRDICANFPIVGEVKWVEVYGSGHINDTYRIRTVEREFILQKINSRVFRNIEGLTSNFQKVSAFITNKIRETDSTMQLPELYPAQSGEFVFQEQPDAYWRLMNFIPGSHSYDRVKSADLAREGGRAYGCFVRMLADFPAEELVETIPRFHDIDFRLQNYDAALERDIAGRKKELSAEIDLVVRYAPMMRYIKKLGEEGEIPLRVTHNDTKINNVLFDSQGKAVAIVDLDTVMPGYVHYDFGDAIRTFTNSALEDEADLQKVQFRKDYYDAFHEGFLSQTDAILNATEKQYLPHSALLMTFIIGLRFLTDYLEGDTYYRTAYEQHNLVRARNQFHLLNQMEKELLLRY